MEEKKQSQGKLVRVGGSFDVLEVCKHRLLLVMAGFAIALSVVCVRLVDVSVFSQVADFKVHSLEREISDVRRSSIVDRNGELLAVNLNTASLYANPKVVHDPKRAIKLLGEIFPDLDQQQLGHRLGKDKSFVWVRRNLTPEQQHKVNALGLAGFYFKNEEKRVYPHKNLLSHVLGFTDVDGNGISGVEKQFNQYLLFDEGFNKLNDPLKLSVDVRVQVVLHEALLDALGKYGGKAAAGLVMDVNNGELLGMTSLPDFDPNNLSGITKDRLFNRSTLGIYEMGSTFKTFSMALGLEEKAVEMHDKYDVSEPIRIANFTIKDYHPKKGLLSVPEIFMYSSNIGTARIADDVGRDKQKDFLSKLGLLSELEVELPEKSAPLYPNRWGRVNMMTISYGHGLAVTPIHLAKATAALVNGGTLYPATLLKRKGEAEGKKVVSTTTSDKIRKLLRLAVKYGTGSKADVEGYLVGGKTGSADKAQKGNYKNNAIISSFVSIFPMHKPKYLVFVMLDEPKGNKFTGWYATGGAVAAPVAGEVIKRVAPVLSVKSISELDYEIRKEFWYDYTRDIEQEVASVGLVDRY